MSLSSKTELARALFRTPPSDSVTRISGTATADSSDGTVTVQLEDGDVIEVGTIGSVSAGDTVTIHVQRGEAQVIASEGWGDAMQAAVDEATAIAEATGQHFWHDTNGAHVTEVTQEQWAVTPSGPNVLVNSLGMLLRRALNYLASFTPSAVTFYDGEGNDTSNVTAQFGTAGAIIGSSGSPRLVLANGGMSGLNEDGASFFDVDYDGGSITSHVDIPYAETIRTNTNPSAIDLSLSETFGDLSVGGTISLTAAFKQVQNSGRITSVTSTTSCTASIDTHGYLNVYISASFVKGTSSTHSAQVVYVTYPSTTVTLDIAFSYDAGTDTLTGSVAFASTTSPNYFFVKANATISYDVVTTAPALTFGERTGTKGMFSASLGAGIEAQGDYQTAIGRYNVADSTSALIVGNGTADNARSNAFTVGFDGEVKSNGTPLVPIGTILDFAGATAPPGYLLCDGSVISRTDYDALFDAIGTRWGGGDGSTTFKIPDFTYYQDPMYEWVSSGVITASSGFTISYQAAIVFGRMVQIFVTATNKSSITVSASGDVTNTTIGTLAADYCPGGSSAFVSQGDGAGIFAGAVGSDGVVSLRTVDGTGSQRSLGSGTTFNIRATLMRSGAPKGTSTTKIIRAI